MRCSTWSNRLGRVLGVLAITAGLWTGCGGSDGDDDPMLDELAAREGAAENPLAEFFPDGLHPNSKGNNIMAGVFAKQIALGKMAKNGEGEPEGERNVVHVVCLGDSITAGGYPAVLAGKTGLNVVAEGVGKETSAGGVSRVGGVLSKHQPDFLCILYGANDVIGAKAAPETVAANLAAIVAAAQANGTVAIVGTLTPMSGSRAQYAESARAVSAAIRTMAAQTGARLADLEKAF